MDDDRNPAGLCGAEGNSAIIDAAQANLQEKNESRLA